MIYLKDTGFVVRRVSLGEADRFVTIFTKNNGKVEVLAKGVRKITSRRSAQIELLNLIRFSSVKSSKNFILTEVDLLNSFEDRRKTLLECQAFFLACELIDNLCPYGQVNEDLFNLIDEYLYKGIFDPENQLEFQTRILIALGYWHVDKKFKNEKESINFIESIIERKIKSKVIGNFNMMTDI